jgi:hypothetical protein
MSTDQKFISVEKTTCMEIIILLMPRLRAGGGLGSLELAQVVS